VKKIILLLSGGLLALSLIIPPNIGKVYFFEYSDLPILFLFVIIFYTAVVNFKSIEENDYPWIFLLLCFVLFAINDELNTTTLRFALYISIGFLVKIISKNLNIKDFELFLIPLLTVSLLNLISFVFNLSFLSNSIGWITNYSDTSNIFLSGRLAGFQGSGPNVAGTVFGIFTILYFYLYESTNKKIHLYFTFLNLFLFLLTYSRGSYLAFLAVAMLFILFKIKSRKFKTYYISSIFISLLFLLYFGPSDYILKENDRSLLASIAISNIDFNNGVGGGNYVEKIYERYLLSVNPDLLAENLKITLNKVELGITPEEYRDTDINFFIGTSGGGFEILQQYFIASPCSDDRNTCQYLRVDSDTMINFLKIFNIYEKETISNAFSVCVDSSQELINRGEFACLAYELKLLNGEMELTNFIDLEDSDIDTKHFSYLKSNFLFVECESSKQYSCKNRPLAIGELSVMIETIFIRKNILPENNLISLCSECEFRNVEGFIKIHYDKYDFILPRSKVTFFTSSDGEEWNIVGYPHYTGEIISVNNNSGAIEIGGNADGQSFGNTWLDGIVHSISIINDNKTRTIYFNEESLNKDYFVYNVNSLLEYKSKITFEEEGIKLFRPNKYWLAIDNNYDFRSDFEIILHLSLPEIPWQTQTLISNTSAFEGDVQSWKVDIDDGRMFFNWTNSDGEYVNQIGDMSLRSGVLVQKNGKISNEQPPLASTSFLSQLTTAHNGYLTFFVEYGLFKGLLFFIPLIFLALNKLISKRKSSVVILYIAIFYFLLHNLTNDLIYSPDAIILFMIILGLKDSITHLKDFENQ
tara:strand:+ start:1880 stop:4312 length:2433 start_codon:yes stop_codon:yes gene_type:complete